MILLQSGSAIMKSSVRAVCFGGRLAVVCGWFVVVLNKEWRNAEF